MTHFDENICNWPNLVSLVRILMAPILMFLAFSQQPNWYIIALIATGFTDVLDGYLARRLNQVTEMGAHLDSWGDFVVYSTMALCAWILWPEILLQEGWYFSLIVASFTLPVVVGLLKFKSITSYHTWSVKLAVFTAYISYILLFTGLAEWPFRVAAVLCVCAALEEIAISFLMRHEHVDVRSVFQAIKYNRSSS